MQTIGEERIRVTFNPSQDPDVREVKNICANLIDFLEVSDGSPERVRCLKIAQDRIEEAAMWAVKGLTA